MNYLIVEILGCLVIAGLLGAILGWFLRGGCQKKLENNSLDWQEKLRKDHLESKNKISLLEEKFLQQLQAKKDEYKIKVNQVVSNQKNQNGDSLQNELIRLKNKLKTLEAERIKNEHEWSLVLEDVESGLKNKLMNNQQSNNRINQENIFLKDELDRSVSELNHCEQENKTKEKALNLLNQKILLLENKLVENNKTWKHKLEERELSWVDKVAVLENADPKVKEMEEALEVCRRDLKIKENILKIKSDTIKREVIERKKDNLKVLRGIGVLLEKDLNKLGIYSLAQIASWSEDDVSKIDRALFLKGKIKKEGWVQQARKVIEIQ